MHDAEAGRALGSRFQLTDRIGEGAMGEVWRARDLRTGEFRAAKLLKSTFASDREIIGRFVQERHILLQLDHPNIVRVHDLVVEGDDLAIVMDLVEGGDLRARLRSHGTLTPRQAVTVTAAVLDALMAAHARQCLHRDVKPDNVLLARPGSLDAGDVRLTDFSIARLAQESTVQATALLGTPGYMPPELFVHGQFSAASDLYAAGILLYELLGGRTPFAGPGTALTVGHRHVGAVPPPLPVAPDLWRVVASMLAKDPRARLGVAATAQALRDLPAAALDVPALPVQRVPDGWDTVGPGSGSSSGAWAGASVEVVDPRIDVGATDLRGGPPAWTPGQPPSWRPGAPGLAGVAAVGESEETQLRGPVLPPTDVASTAPARRAPSRRAESTRRPERRIWPWAAGAAAVLVVALGAVVVPGLASGGDRANDAPTGNAPVELVADADYGTAPSGFGMGSRATYDIASGVAEVTFVLEAQGSGLEGPFLQVLPIPDGSISTECPLVTYPGGEGQRVPQGTEGVEAACAWQVDASLDRQGTAEVTAQVPLDLELDLDGPDPEAPLRAWLAQIGDETSTALEQVRSGTSFAAQRITGIEVSVLGPVQLYDLVRLTVNPVWSSGAGATDPVFVSGALRGGDLERSTTLDQVTGVAGGGLSIDTCVGKVLQQGMLLRAQQPGPCTVTVQLGQLAPVTRPFSINGMRN